MDLKTGPFLEDCPRPSYQNIVYTTGRYNLTRLFIIIEIVSSLSIIFISIHCYHSFLFKGVYSALLIFVVKHFSKDYKDHLEKDEIEKVLIDVFDVLQKMCRGNKLVRINMIVVLLLSYLIHIQGTTKNVSTFY